MSDDAVLPEQTFEPHQLESLLGHKFQRPDLLTIALTHRSFYFENRLTSLGHFERLEFLGDAVLDMVLSELLMERFPEVEEGTLSKWRASLVNENCLFEVAKEINLGPFLNLGKSEHALREQPRPRLLASALEALIGALYLDAGLLIVRKTLLDWFAKKINGLSRDNEFASDYKTKLQEWAQKKYRQTPEYQLIATEGPEHAKIFRYEVRVAAELLGQGEGNSRKSAEQDAAKCALNFLNNSMTQENKASSLEPSPEKNTETV